MKRKDRKFVFNYRYTQKLVLATNRRIKSYSKNLFKLIDYIKATFKDLLIIYQILRELINNFNYDNIIIILDNRF